MPAYLELERAAPECLVSKGVESENLTSSLNHPKVKDIAPASSSLKVTGVSLIP